MGFRKAADKRKRARIRWALALFCCVCVCLPPVLARFPPILDLAQQTAQIRLLGESLSDHAAPYRVQWLGSNKISYVVLGISWLAAPAALAGRLAVMLISVIWVGAYHRLATKRGRPSSAAVLGSIFLFNHFFYLGFLNFATGFAVFTLWLNRMADPPPGSESPRRTIAEAFIGSLLLYWAHALWLAAGAGWLWFNSLVRKHPMRPAALRTAGMLPFLALTLALHMSLTGSGWGSKVMFAMPELRHFASTFYVDYALGGLRGWLEPAACAAVLLWAAIAAWQNRKRLRDAFDRPLLAAGILFVAAGMLLPTMVGNTLHFGSRWMPVGCALLVLALPPVRAAFALSRITAAIVLAAFCAGTAGIWLDFDRREMSGFAQAMEAIEPGSALLGLDFDRQSDLIKTPVSYQMYAYSQVLHGGDINWSFAGAATSLVVYRDEDSDRPWTKGLTWHPERVQPSDFGHFDYTLIHGSPEVQDRCAREGGLIPVTGPDTWRLFKVRERAD